MSESTRLAVGVAGWSYPDWRDTVYRLSAPPVQPDLFGGVSRAGKTEYAADELAFLSRYVDMVEINSSFYRIPRVDAVASWVERVAARPDFFFTAKLNQAFTHGFQRDGAQAVAYRRAMQPLQEAGKLKGLLVQFRYDVAATPETRRHFEWITSQFAELAPLVVEVRHRSWETAESIDFLKSLGVSVASLDYPTAADSFTADLTLTDSAYLRLHGRNRQAWFARDTEPHEPYNYDYSGEEITNLATRSEGILGKVRQLTIVANNHYRGKAMSAALRLKAELLKQTVDVPPALLDTYPGLERIAN